MRLDDDPPEGTPLGPDAPQEEIDAVIDADLDRWFDDFATRLREQDLAEEQIIGLIAFLKPIQKRRSQQAFRTALRRLMH